MLAWKVFTVFVFTVISYKSSVSELLLELNLVTMCLWPADRHSCMSVLCKNSVIFWDYYQLFFKHFWYELWTILELVTSWCWENYYFWLFSLLLYIYSLNSCINRFYKGGQSCINDEKGNLRKYFFAIRESF